MLARLRIEAGYTQEAFVLVFAQWAQRLGTSAAVSVRQLRRWESPSPPLPHPAQQVVLEAIFGLPLEEMGFSVPANRRSTTGPMSDDDPVRRRRFIADLGGMTASAVLPTGRRIGTADVGRFRRRIDLLYGLDHASGGSTALAHARGLLRVINHRLGDGTAMERVTVQLQAMLGEIHCHLGWIAHDAGRADEARAAVLEAMATARMTGDIHLEMRALSTVSLLAAGRGRAWEAASAATAALAVADGRGGPGVRLVLALRQSRAALSGGDLAASRQALSAAVSLHDRAAEEPEPPRWVGFAGSVEIDYATGVHYLKAGRPQAAIPFLRSAVDGLGAGYARNVALYRARLACVLLAAGEAEEACHLMVQVARDARVLTSARLADRLAVFHRDAVRVGTPAAHELAHLLRTGKERPT